jgi:MFS transporter, Spinster family, sphingosine-1-phosphate transporter
MIVEHVSALPEPLDSSRRVTAESTGPSSPPVPAPISARWTWGVVLLFFVMHLLDWVDRWLLAAVLPKISEELNLSGLQAGWLSTVLLLGLAAASLPIGYLADRLRRPRLLGIGFALWSLATVATGLAQSYDQLQVARALVGVGSAIFEIVALTMIMDRFPRAILARVLAIFFLAAPTGAALGLSVVGAFAHVTTWQTAFLVVGAPGLLLALLSLLLPDPVRGSSEGVEIERLRLHERVGPSREDYIDLMVNSSYTYSVFGITFSSFALAGLVYWSPTFVAVAKGLPEDRAGSPLLLMTFLGAGFLGTAVGGWLADRSAKFNPRALFVGSGLGMMIAIPFTLAAIYGRTRPWIFGGLFVAEGLMFMNIVPCYTIIASVVMPNMRAVACAAALASIHVLGDIWSPTLMGWTSDTFGQPDSMATIFGTALTALGAVPVAQPGRDPENFTAGMLVVIPALVISGIVLLAGSRHLLREMALMLAKLRATPSRLRPIRPGSVTSE